MNEIDKCKNDLLYFVKQHVYIENTVNSVIRFEPTDEQIKLLHNLHNNPHNLEVCDRQTGKTTCSAIYLLWRAMFYPGEAIVFIGANDNSIREFTRILHRIYEMCPEFIRSKKKCFSSSTTTFENGSTIRGVSSFSKNTCGISGSIVYCDEFLFFNPEFFCNTLPVLWSKFSRTILITSKDEARFDLDLV